jgi:hypothetical protein
MPLASYQLPLDMIDMGHGNQLLVQDEDPAVHAESCTIWIIVLQAA